MNLQILKAETGVKDEEIIRVPGLFHESEFSGFIRKARQKDGAPPPRPPTAPAPPPGLTGPREEITYGPGSQIAYYPGR